uniref:Transmembrane protein n=1 Tax=Chromera velia CCMP2878 TaxID=1169474 RepID=A0A0G4IEN9_9ALVE|eukprot:Cvel_13767.t1-p1 / transcript=Cvel_13767.t1 / gene=Cvel_13767 / organism=Chromera_velia_CCMP2878 / gene_product=hypothetical protein / transcript_product=hypothetical protein / location=Cvel_scaffold953:51261-54850(+) / protein_length=530 / sequence_SO=supercontig / SO=protein_coding / is_pseudo=false
MRPVEQRTFGSRIRRRCWLCGDTVFETSKTFLFWLADPYAKPSPLMKLSWFSVWLSVALISVALILGRWREATEPIPMRASLRRVEVDLPPPSPAEVPKVNPHHHSPMAEEDPSPPPPRETVWKGSFAERMEILGCNSENPAVEVLGECADLSRLSSLGGLLVWLLGVCIACLVLTGVVVRRELREIFRRKWEGEIWEPSGILSICVWTSGALILLVHILWTLGTANLRRFSSPGLSTWLELAGCVSVLVATLAALTGRDFAREEERRARPLFAFVGRPPAIQMGTHFERGHRGSIGGGVGGRGRIEEEETDLRLIMTRPEPLSGRGRELLVPSSFEGGPWSYLQMDDARDAGGPVQGGHSQGGVGGLGGFGSQFQQTRREMDKLGSAYSGAPSYASPSGSGTGSAGPPPETWRPSRVRAGWLETPLPSVIASGQRQQQQLARLGPGSSASVSSGPASGWGASASRAFGGGGAQYSAVGSRSGSESYGQGRQPASSSEKGGMGRGYQTHHGKRREDHQREASEGLLTGGI